MEKYFQLFLMFACLFCCGMGITLPEASQGDLQTSASSAKLSNILGYNPNYYGKTFYPTNGGSGFGYNYNSGNGGYGGYGPTNVIGLYPNKNYYPTSSSGYGSYGGYNNYDGYNSYGNNGWGGYGGYGGNGGHHAYYGYMNPYYTGNRNLGFGYLTKTDGFGFPYHGGFRG